MVIQSGTPQQGRRLSAGPQSMVQGEVVTLRRCLTLDTQLSPSGYSRQRTGLSWFTELLRSFPTDPFIWEGPMGVLCPAWCPRICAMLKGHCGPRTGHWQQCWWSEGPWQGEPRGLAYCCLSLWPCPRVHTRGCWARAESPSTRGEAGYQERPIGCHVEHRSCMLVWLSGVLHSLLQTCLASSPNGPLHGAWWPPFTSPSPNSQELVPGHPSFLNGWLTRALR